MTQSKPLFLHNSRVADSITRVVYTCSEDEPKPSILITEEFKTEDGLALTNYSIDGEPIVKYKYTANGEVAYVENIKQLNAGTAYQGRLTFTVSEDEAIYGWASMRTVSITTMA